MYIHCTCMYIFKFTFCGFCQKKKKYTGKCNQQYLTNKILVFNRYIGFSLLIETRGHHVQYLKLKQ